MEMVRQVIQTKTTKVKGLPQFFKNAGKKGTINYRKISVSQGKC